MADYIQATLPLLRAVLTRGDLNGVLPLVGASINAQNASDAYVSGALPLLGASLSAVVGGVASVSGVLPSVQAALSGGSSALVGSVPLVSSSITGLVGHSESIAATLPSVGVAIVGNVAFVGVVTAALPRVESSLVGVVGGVGSITTTQHAPHVSINAQLGTNASLAAALTLISANVDALQGITGTITATLPSLHFTATAYIPFAQVATYITNTISSALMTYEAFPFNSFAEINGKYYGAGPAGLFELTGDKDDTGGTNTDITASLATGQLHFGSEMQKRMSDFFVAMRSDGDITLTVTIDEKNSYDYTLSPKDIAELKQRRSLIGKGAKGKYWQFALANTNGCDFDFDSFNAAAVVLSRRT